MLDEERKGTSKTRKRKGHERTRRDKKRQKWKGTERNRKKRKRRNGMKREWKDKGKERKGGRRGRRGRRRRWSILHPGRCLATERLESVERDDPWRYGGAEVLRAEGAQWDVLPLLDVAGGPVVHQHQAEDVVLGGVASVWDVCSWGFLWEIDRRPSPPRGAVVGRTHCSDSDPPSACGSAIAHVGCALDVPYTSLQSFRDACR